MIKVEEEISTRIDSYLAEKLSISRSKVQKLIKEDKVLVNGKKVNANYQVKLNDEIEVNDELNYEINIEPENIPLDIVYEDDDLLVINKKSGMVVHPAPGHYTKTLVNALLYHFNIESKDKIRPGIVHRLDKDTSGLLIIAKNDKAHIQVSEQIKNREVKKTYIALVRGTIAEDEATINMPIGRSTKDRKKMAVTKNGKEAVTHFKVLNRYTTNKGSYTLLEIKIDTGRTHQIRVHMAEIGHPVIGDSVYSNGKNEFGVEGQCLHAKRLEFVHPITGKEMKLEAPLPEYFQKIVEQLENR